MYIQDTSHELAGLGKFKLKKIFKAPAKIVRKAAKVVKKTAKAAGKVVKKVAPLALAAGAAYFAPQLLPAILARRGGAAGAEGGPPMDESGAPPTASQEAIARAAREYYSRLPRQVPPQLYYPSSALPRPMSRQPFPYSEAEEADYAQPAGPAPFGAALGNLKVPLIAAAIGIPLLMLATRPPERRR